MPQQKDRRRLKRLGKNAAEIFDSRETSLAPTITNQPTDQSSTSSLVGIGPAVSWGLWWQDLYHQQTRTACRLWWGNY